ncbi:PQQ-binding-like beta-propeller repeat protein [Pilimelia columellifera]|uniref:Pyrrolo-quinoline quinone repeat domain-containing protein n=1 Tax=Pilimelia columellifera subsp. columellifera TaxID=706583 RepID=A0ABN3NU56_9ACTN
MAATPRRNEALSDTNDAFSTAGRHLRRRTVLAAVVGTAVTAAAGLAAAGLPGSALAAAPGPRLRGDGGRERWSLSTGAKTLAVAGNRVIIDQGAAVVALSAAAGSQLWKVDLPPDKFRGVELAADAQHVALTYAVKGSGPDSGPRNVEIRVLNVSDGSQRWAQPLGGKTLQLHIHGDRVLVGLGYTKSSFKDGLTWRVTDGAQRWPTARDQWPVLPAAANDHPARALFTPTGGHSAPLALRDLITGVPIWERLVDSECRLFWNRGDHLVALQVDRQYRQTLVQLDARTGAQGWEFPLGIPSVPKRRADPRAENDPTPVPVVLAGAVAIAKAEGGQLVAVDLHSGTEVWRHTLGRELHALAATDSHTHVVADRDNGPALLSLHTANGAAAAAPLPTSAYTRLAVSPSTLYTLDDGHLTALRPQR